MRTVFKRLKRFAEGGVSGLHDHGSRPGYSPRRVAPAKRRRIVALQRALVLSCLIEFSGWLKTYAGCLPIGSRSTNTAAAVSGTAIMATVVFVGLPWQLVVTSRPLR